MADHVCEPRIVASFECGDHRLVLGDGSRPFVRLLVADEADALQPRARSSGAATPATRCRTAPPAPRGSPGCASNTRAGCRPRTTPSSRRGLRAIGRCRRRSRCGRRGVRQAFSSATSTSSMSRTSCCVSRLTTAPRPGNELDQALARQNLERLAQRRPRHAERLAELALVDPGAGGELALDHQLADPVDDLVVQRAAIERLDRRRYVRRDVGSTTLIDGLCR